MSCCCCSSSAIPIPNYECERLSVNVQTSAGRTFCAVYYPRGKAFDTLAQTCSEVVLLIHGLGGCSKHWEDSEIAPMLASRNCCVVCIDLFTHGKSEKFDNRQTKHTVDFFLNQIYDIIHHPQLPLHAAKNIVMQGFSFGGFLTLNYLVKYHGDTPCCAKKHCVHKAVLHSPWDGNLPAIVKMLIYVPGLLRLCRPSDMKYIRSIAALKQILLHSNKHDKFSTRVKELVNMVRKNDQTKMTTVNQANSMSDSPVEHVALDVEEMLFIAGSVEFFFSKNAKRLYNATAKRNKNVSKSGNSTSQLTAVDNEHYRLKICCGADHMTFVHCTEGRVGEYFRREIEDFICPSSLSNINIHVLDFLPPSSGSSEKSPSAPDTITGHSQA